MNARSPRLVTRSPSEARDHSKPTAPLRQGFPFPIRSRAVPLKVAQAINVKVLGLVRLCSGEDDMADQHDLTEEPADDEVRARREFLLKCGKYAVVVPPAMALLLTRDANAGNNVCTSVNPNAGCVPED